MTLEEKLAELGGITGRSPNQRLGLNSGGGSDGPNGIASMGSGPPQARGRNVTAFANAVTLAATWDRKLASQYGKALGEEFIGKGSNTVLGPTINIMRTWHWGRNGETFSEDPYLTAEIAVAEIQALNEQKVLTVLKHYAANNQENSRCGVIPDNAGIDARISEKALHEIYLPGFKASVERAKTGGIMCFFNQVNGKFACNHPQLLGYLREWGYDGFIAPDAAFALRDALTAVRAGVTRAGGKELGNFLKEGKIEESDLDRMLYYNLTPYFRLGIFDSPSTGKADVDVSTPEHQALARKVAEEGAVLLKNKLHALPIDAAKVKSIAVIGDDAGPNVTIGFNGSGHVYATRISVPLNAIKARAGDAVKVIYAQGTAGIGPLPPIPDSVLRADSGEGSGLLARYFNSGDPNGLPVISRIEPGVQNISNPPAEFYSVLGLPAPANPRTIVVLHNSNPVAMPWLDKVAAVLEAFYPGQEAGSSIARLLFGDVNPSGKLAMTFPANEHQGPGAFFLDYPGDGMTVNYSEGVLVGYRWYDAKRQEPLFPFGYGLSYTTFRYSDLQIKRTSKLQFEVNLRITNTGSREGAEVVQLYLGFPEAAEEPPKQLKGFEKIHLKPGESKPVAMKIDENNLAFWDTESHGWKILPGAYSVMVGSSSRDIRLKSTFTVPMKL